MSEYQPSGCRAVFGVAIVGLGLFVLVAFFPVSIIPAAMLIGGGARLILGSGVL